MAFHPVPLQKQVGCSDHKVFLTLVANKLMETVGYGSITLVWKAHWVKRQPEKQLSISSVLQTLTLPSEHL